MNLLLLTIYYLTKTADPVGLTAAKNLKYSLSRGNFSDICGCFNLMARKIGTSGDREANPVSSYILRDSISLGS